MSGFPTGSKDQKHRDELDILCLAVNVAHFSKTLIGTFCQEK